MRVGWAPEAISDLDRALRYVAERDPAAAALVAHRIRRAIRNIGYFPGVGRLHERTGTREYLVCGLPLPPDLHRR